jgi:hypothetical protein
MVALIFFGDWMASSGSKQTRAHSSASQPANILAGPPPLYSPTACIMLTAVNGSYWMDNLSL